MHCAYNPPFFYISYYTKVGAVLRSGKFRAQEPRRQSLPEIVFIVRIYYVPPSDFTVMKVVTISKFNGT